MRVKFLLMGLCLLSLSVQAARIALTGNTPAARNIAELTLSELSGEFEFVERQELASILGELDLQTTLGAARAARHFQLSGAELFGIVTADERGKLSFTLFETTCGLRLAKIRLPADRSAATAAVAKALRRARTQLADPSKLRLISIGGMRDNLTGDPPMKKSAHAVGETVLDALQDAGVLILERDYIFELAMENRLTGKWENQLYASEIFNLEFNPGKTEDTFTVKAYFLAPDDRIAMSCSADGPAPDMAQKLIGEIKRHLETPTTPGGFNRSTEASRLAREAQLMGGDQANHRYFAAFALDPAQEKYLMEINLYRASNSDAEYPFFRFVFEFIYNQETLFRRVHYSNLITAIRNASAQLDKFSAANQRDFREFRAHIRERMLVYYRHKEAPVYQAIERFQNLEPFWYDNAAAYQTAKQASFTQLLQNVAKARTSWTDKRFFPSLIKNEFYHCTHALFQWQETIPRNRQKDWTRERVEELEQCGLAEVRPMGKLLEANLLLYSRDYTQEKVLDLYRDYAQECRNAGIDTVDINYLLSQKAERFPGLKDRLQTMSKEWQTPPAAGTSAPVPNAVPAPAPAQTTASAPPGGYYASREQQAASVKQLAPLVGDTPENWAALVRLNPEWKLNKIYPPASEKCDILVSTVDPELKTVWFFTYDDFDYILMRLDLATGAVAEVGRYGLPSEFGPSPARNYDWQMTVREGTAVIWQTNLIFVRRPDDQWSEIGKVSVQRIHSTFAGDGRIWLCTEDSLISCLPSGDDRKVHFAGRQEEAMLPQQRQDPSLKIFWAQPGLQPGEIILLLCFASQTRPKVELWKYRTADNDIRKITDAPIFMPGQWSKVQRAGTRLYFSASNGCNPTCFMVFDLETEQCQVVACSGIMPDDLAKWFNIDLTKGKRLASGHQASGPFLMYGSWLLSTGQSANGQIMSRTEDLKNASGICDLKKYPDGPVWRYPVVNGLYPVLGKRQVIAVEYHRIVTIEKR